MTQGNDRSISVGGNVTGSSFSTGDSNTVTTSYQQVTLPPADSVDVQAELDGLREALAGLQAPEAAKIAGALDAAEAEAQSAEPDKEEVAGRVERALKLAQQAEGFSAHLEKLAPRIVKLAGWIGDVGKRLLPFVGLCA